MPASLRLLLLTAVLLLLLPFRVCAGTAVVTQETLRLTVERVSSPARPGELAELAVEVVYREGMTQDDYPDFIALEEDLRRWLAAASPAAADESGKVAVPWSGLLSSLARRVLENYQPVTTVILSVAPFPSVLRPQTAEFSLEANRGGTEPRLALQVPLRRHGLEHQGPNVIDLITTARYSGAEAGQVPDGESLRLELVDLLANYPTESDYWETLIKALGATLLKRHEAFDAIELKLTVYPTATLTYPHEVFASLERSPVKTADAASPLATPAAPPEVIHLADQAWYEAEDRAVARELVSPRNSSTEALSIAEIVVPPGVTVRPHRHHMEEVYHVLAGTGVVMVEDQTQTVSAGDTILIPPDAWHNIVNGSATELRLHVTCVPAWAPEHLIFERRAQTLELPAKG